MDLDTSCFKAFKLAAMTLNFTEAAKKANMTQSGVSSHIAKLENELKAPLFFRLGKKVQMTEAAYELLSFIEQYEDRAQRLIDSIQESKSELKGIVRYSMPESCLLSPHFSLLLKDKLKNFPNVDLMVNIEHSENVIKSVLEHQTDFGFVTKRVINSYLNYEPFCFEDYVLASSSNSKIIDLENAKWIQYPGFDDIFNKWLHSQKKTIKNLKGLTSGQSNSLRACLTMVAYGLGITVIPKHCIENFTDHKNIRMYEKDYQASLNQIYIVTLQDQKRSARVQHIISTFKKMKIV